MSHKSYFPTMSICALIAITVLLLTFGWHLSVGAKSIPLNTVFKAFTAFDNTEFDHIVIRELRLNRAIIALLVGSALAVSGALMQGVTRNVLAEPGILGVSSGASFAVVFSIGFFGLVSPVFMPLVAAIGAICTATIVWGIAAATPSGTSPLTLVLSGAVMTAFLGALITVMHLIDADSFQNLRVWLSGSLVGRKTNVIFWVAPWLVTGFVIALAIARQVTALSMGKETAIGMGVDTKKIQQLVLVAVITLTAGAVALAGPLGFVGLVIPHVVRLFVGSDYRFIVPFSGIVGAIYVLAVDALARVIFAPLEISTGIMTALFGAPFFVWLIRVKL